jgi:enolase
MKITDIIGREIFNSQGLPTLECTLVLDDSFSVSASVPRGMSRSSFEAVPLYDGGTRVNGLGVYKAIEKLQQDIAAVIIGKEPRLVELDLALIDLDGTQNKSRIGANTMLAASIAICKANALEQGQEVYELITQLCEYDSYMLPIPFLNIINGGLHAHNALHIQEFSIVPVGMHSFREAFQAGLAVFHTLKALLIHEGRGVAVGDEGGFASNFKNEGEALDFLMEALSQSRTMYEGDFMIALDMAASTWYDPHTQQYTIHNRTVTAPELVTWYEKLISSYPIYAIEDGMAETDIEGWRYLFKTIGNKVRLIGDDIFATNPHRIWEGLQEGITDTIIIKPNQIGTVTETLQSVKLCKENDLQVIVSHRSGETNDDFIADLAVGVSSTHIKAGGCSRGERMAKYNRLLTIEDELLHGDSLF